MSPKKSVPTFRCLAGQSSLILIILILLVLTLNTFAGEATTDQTTKLSITPPTYIAKAIGELCPFYIDIFDVQNLSSACFTISCDGSTLQFCSIALGSFFPPTPTSFFKYEIDGSNGLLKVNLTLANPSIPLWGNGTLVSFVFRVTQKPITHLVSTINFAEISLLDTSSKKTPNDSTSATCFLYSTEPDPSGQGLIQASTDKEGGRYTVGGIVTLSSRVTFGGDPVRNKLVAFQVIDPFGITLTMSVVQSDQNGNATFSFRVPETSCSVGIWESFFTVDLDQETFWTTVNFQVTPASTVGGYSYAVKSVEVPERFTLYEICIVLMILALILLRSIHLW